jgi:hypothetical protein
MLLVCVDYFSEFVRLVPVREAKCFSTVKAHRYRVFSTFLVPSVIVSDNAVFHLSTIETVLFRPQY